MKQQLSANEQELSTLCATVRELTVEGRYNQCEVLIFNAMERYPHAAEPHNLIGVLLEKEGDHLMAMKHFRAAQALDPTYLPARQNLESFGTFYSSGRCAYDESDCVNKKSDEYTMKRDDHGIGHLVRRS